MMNRFLGVILFVAGPLLIDGGDPEYAAGQEPSAKEKGRAPLAFPSVAELENVAALEPAQTRSTSRESLLARVEGFAKKLPKNRYDLEAFAKAQGSGLEAALTFVRDRVRFEAYPGVLRGANQTFIGRAGNSFDRTLLLAQLLQRQGIKTRYVRGKLSDELAKQLLDRVFEAGPAGAEPVLFSATPGSLLDRVRARAVRDYVTIRTALGDSLPRGAPDLRGQALKEIQDHLWLQARFEDRWVDIDSSFGDAKPGKVYGDDGKVLEKLPEDAYQRITVRVLTETLDGTSLKQDKCLEVAWPASWFMNREVFLLHLPGAGAGLVGAVGGGGQKDLWRPALQIDGKIYAGKPVAFADGGAGGKMPPKGGLGGLFGPGGALGNNNQLVAEWLEFEITFSDKRREVTRRALMDRAGIAWRQADKKDGKALQPIPRDTEGPTTPREIHNIWISSGPHNLAAFADAVGAWTKLMLPKEPAVKADKPTKPTQPTLRQSLWPFALQNYAFLVLADNQVAPSLNDSAAYRFYADTPRIFLFTVGPSPGTKDGEAFFLFDMHRNRLRGLPRAAADEAYVAQRRMWHGLLEGALEHEVGQVYLIGAKDSLLTTTGLLGDKGVVVFRGEKSRKSADWPRDPRMAAAAERSLRAGRTLIVPRELVAKGPLAWWEIAADGITRPVLGENWNGGKGVIPKHPTGFPADRGGWGAHLPPPDQPGGLPSEGDVEFPKPDDGKTKAKRGGGGNEFMMVLENISLNAVDAVHTFADRALFYSSVIAVKVASYLADFLP